tara:strand:- start:6247 stop:7128 length:882 start_codon:yes stop_codon:yes gene_type:complete
MPVDPFKEKLPYPTGYSGGYGNVKKKKGGWWGEDLFPFEKTNPPIALPPLIKQQQAQKKRAGEYSSEFPDRGDPSAGGYYQTGYGAQGSSTGYGTGESLGEHSQSFTEAMLQRQRLGLGAGSQQFKRGLSGARLDTGGLGYDPAMAAAAQQARSRMLSQGQAKQRLLQSIEEQLAREDQIGADRLRAGLTSGQYAMDVQTAARERANQAARQARYTAQHRADMALIGSAFGALGAGGATYAAAVSEGDESDRNLKQNIRRVPDERTDSALRWYSDEHDDGFDAQLVRALQESE